MLLFEFVSALPLFGGPTIDMFDQSRGVPAKMVPAKNKNDDFKSHSTTSQERE